MKMDARFRGQDVGSMIQRLQFEVYVSGHRVYGLGCRFKVYRQG